MSVCPFRLLLTKYVSVPFRSPYSIISVCPFLICFFNLGLVKRCSFHQFSQDTVRVTKIRAHSHFSLIFLLTLTEPTL